MNRVHDLKKETTKKEQTKTWIFLTLLVSTFNNQVFSQFSALFAFLDLLT